MTPEQVIAQLTDIGLQSLEAAQRGALIVGERIVADAKEKAPGSLSEAINVSQTENETTIVAGAEIAAYVEFGTGSAATGGDAKEYIATLPEEWQELAHEFFAGGLGSGKKQPFFYPAVFTHQEELIPEIEIELSKLAQ